MSKKKPAEVTEEVKEVTEEMTEKTRPKYPSRRYGDAEHDDRLPPLLSLNLRLTEDPITMATRP